MLNILHAESEATGLGEYLLDLASGNAVGLWGVIFAVVMIANLLSYKFSGKNDKKSMSVLGGALLGLIPGCGGTIVVTSMFAKKKATFGAVLAAFIATLGDGSFGLLAISFQAFAIVTAISFVVAIIVGYSFNALGGERFLPAEKVKVEKVKKTMKEDPLMVFKTKVVTTYLFWPLMVLGMIYVPLSLLDITGGIYESLADKTLIDLGHVIENPFMKVLAVTTMVLSLIYWRMYKHVYKNQPCDCANDLRQHLIHGLKDATMIMAIIMIATGVVGAIIDLGVGEHELEHFLEGWGVLFVVIAALFAALPGCATFVAVVAVVAGIYGVDGEILWGVLIAGSIATSGDGFFGLLAVSKEKAGIITLFSIVLAIVIGVPIHLIFN